MKLRRRHPVAALFFLLVITLLSGPAQAADTLYYLHSDGNTCTPGPDPSASSFTLDSTSPTATDAKCRDSSSVNRTTFVEIGTWSAAPVSPAQQITALSDLHAWIGLQNSDDVGTYFDLEAQLLKNGQVIATGVTQTIQGVVRNANQAKEVTVTFGTISDNQLTSGDTLSVKILTKVADSGGHSSAAGLRLYYDADTRTSRFGATLTPVSTLGNLTQARSGHTATIESDGSVLITGGQSTNGPSASAERFDPLSLTFSPLSANMGAARMEQSASALPNLTTLIVAGQNSDGILSGAELYDPSTGLFSGLSDTVRIPRSGHTATVLLDGRVLIAGGQGSSTLGSAEAFDAQSAVLFKPSFDPHAGAFTVLSNALSTPRWDHTATLLPNGQVLITGGRNESGYLSSAEIFDPVTESFAAVPGGMTVPRSGHSATLMPDGRLLILGGQNSTGYLVTGEWFDPATGTFAAATQGLTAARTDHTATLLYSGEILITGGQNATGVLATNELYGPPQTDTTSPNVVQASPQNGATGIDLTGIIGVRFSEPVDVTTLNSGSVSLTGSASGGGAVDSLISPSEQGLMVFIVPKNPLSPGTTYTISLTSSVRDTSGNPLVPFTSSFTTVAAPTITDILPNHAPGGTGVTITGQNFDPSAPTMNVVKFGGISAVVASATATQIETSVPFGVPVGPATVTVTTRGGTVTATFAVENPIPTLVFLSPNSVVAGSGPFTLTLNGSNFIPSSYVNFGAAALNPISVGSTQIQVNVPASGVATPGTIQVTVTNPAPGGGTSNALTFSVIGPVITGLSPDNGPIGTPVTITGLNFDPTASNNQVNFNGTAAIISSATTTTIQTVVPQNATTGPVTVTTPAGTATSGAPFTVTLPQDFGLTVAPASAGLVAGSYRYISIGATGTNGFSELITLTAGSLPTGLSMLMLPAQIAPGALSLVEVVADATMSPGTYPVTAIGTAVINGQPVTHSIPFSVQILGGGTTTLTGLVLSTDNRPIQGALVVLGNANSYTDASGTFFLSNVPDGHQMVLVDGRTAITPGSFYPEVVVAVELTAGAGNVMPYIVYLPRIDTAHPIDLPVDASGTITQAFTATTPAIPDLEVNFPVGTQIIDPDGNPVSQITITAVPGDRSPMPFPAGAPGRQLFTIQPGGSTLSQPVPITFPNLDMSPPGTPADFYYFDVTTGTWILYGQGSVSDDGRQVVPDPGVGIPRFAWHYVIAREITPTTNPGPDDPPNNGDPVDMSTGLFTMKKTDMMIPGRIPTVLTRYYHSAKTSVGLFGVGTGHSLDTRLIGSGVGSGMLVLLKGDDSRYPFHINPDGSYTNDTNPSMAGVVVTQSGTNRVMTFKDGSRWIFNSNGLILEQDDRNGNALTYERSAGLLISVGSDPFRRLTFTYTGSRISRVTDPLGRTVQYGYDSNSRLVSVTDPSGGITRYDYDSQNRMTTLTDARGILFLQNTYDDNNRVVQQTNADGGVYHYQYYSPNGQARATEIIRPGPVNPLCANAPVVTINAGDSVRGSAICQVIYVIVPGFADYLVAESVAIDPIGNVTTYRFNGQGYLVEETRPDGSVVQYDRAIGNNRLKSTTDPLGRTTQYTYDSVGNTTSITDADGNITRFEYEPAFNRVKKITDALGHVTQFTYDTHGNMESTTDPAGHITTLTYDVHGQPLNVTDPLSNATQFEYDPFGNLTATVDPLGNRTNRAYDLVSRLTALTDPLGRTTNYTYDSLNRVTQITDPAQGVTGFTYDPNGNLLTVRDANGHVTTHTYDDQDRLATRTDPLGLMENYVYDFNNNLTRFTDRKGQVSQFGYDAMNRRIESDYGDGSLTTFTYDNVSRLTEVYDSVSGLIRMGYDDLDRLTLEVTPQGTLSYTYDAIGRRTSMEANGLAPVNYQYDNASRLTQVAQGSNTVNLGYDNAGRRTSLTYPNGTATNYFYDNASRLNEIFHQGPSGVIEDLLYTYDAAGNRISFDRTNPQAALPQEIQAAYNAANQMTHFNTDTLTYDANGNLTFDGTTTYTWDARNRLVQMTNGSLFSNFVYDALGRRVSKTINGASTQYLYDGNDIIAEIQYGAISATYLRSLNIDEPFLRASAVAEYYHTDALGSTLALTDQNGAMQTTYSYDPFGDTTVAGTTSNPFQYNGRENDGMGLYFYRARYYNPQLERFINPDPLLCGATNNFPLKSVKHNSQTLNTFAYVTNSPINLRDPLGLTPECQYYDMRCEENSGSSFTAAVGKFYYCNASKYVCEKAPRDPYFNCVRQCLQVYDNTQCAPKYGRKSVATVACQEFSGHAFCFTKCINWGG